MNVLSDSYTFAFYPYFLPCLLPLFYFAYTCNIIGTYFSTPVMESASEIVPNMIFSDSQLMKCASFAVLSFQSITRGNIIEASLFSYDLNLCRWGFMSWMALWYIFNTSSKWMSTCFTSAAADRYFIRLNCLVSMEPWSCGLITSSIMQGSVCESTFVRVCVCVNSAASPSNKGPGWPKGWTQGGVGEGDEGKDEE